LARPESPALWQQGPHYPARRYDEAVAELAVYEEADEKVSTRPLEI